MLQLLLEKLFAAFKLPDSSENEYVMKCIMRVIMFVGQAIAPVAVPCLQVRSVAPCVQRISTRRTCSREICAVIFTLHQHAPLRCPY